MYKKIREEEENQRSIFPSRSFKETLRVLSDQRGAAASPWLPWASLSPHASNPLSSLVNSLSFFLFLHLLQLFISLLLRFPSPFIPSVRQLSLLSPLQTSPARILLIFNPLAAYSHLFLSHPFPLLTSPVLYELLLLFLFIILLRPLPSFHPSNLCSP